MASTDKSPPISHVLSAKWLVLVSRVRLVVTWYVEQRSTAGYLRGASCARFSVCENKIFPLDAAANRFTPPKCLQARILKRADNLPTSLFKHKVKYVVDTCTGKIFCPLSACHFPKVFLKISVLRSALANVCRKRKAALWNSSSLHPF